MQEAVTDHSPGTEDASAIAADVDGRDLRLDAYRGLALWFILIDHIPDNALGWLTLRNYGFSDTTEVFVFISGYTCMLAYGGELREWGWPTTITRALRRGLEIYAAFLLLLFAYFGLVWATGDSRTLDATNTNLFFQDPGAAILHAMVLQYAPVNTDILPTFVLLHLSFPGVLWVMTRKPAIALTGSFLLYLMVQAFNWHLPAWPHGEMYFNPLAWQALFVFGAWYAQEGSDWLRNIVRSRTALWLAIPYLAFSLAVALSWQTKALEGWVPDALARLIYPIDKSHLAPLRLLHFLALAVLVVRLTPRHWSGFPKPLITAMIRCGENSLAVYCLSVLLSFTGSLILTRINPGFLMQATVSIAGIALMTAAATSLTLEAKLDRRGPPLF